MRVNGISAWDVEQITRDISSDLWEDNVRAEVTDLGHGPRTGPRCSFVLRVSDSKDVGARRAASGRRTVSACWHAHRDVLRALFMHNRTARITSALADYRGKADFEDRFPGTYHSEAGSIVNPVSFGDLCSCQEVRPRPPAVARSCHNTPGEYTQGPDVANATRVAAIADEELAAWAEILDNARSKKTS